MSILINAFCIFVLFFFTTVLSNAAETITIRPQNTHPGNTADFPGRSYDGDENTSAVIPKDEWLLVNTTAQNDLGKINNVYINILHKNNGTLLSLTRADFYWRVGNFWGPAHGFTSYYMQMSTSFDVTGERTPWMWNDFATAKLGVYNTTDNNIKVYAYEVYFTVNYSPWPKIQEAETIDDDRDGFLDAYRLTFNVPMNDSSLSNPNVWFTISGRNNITFNPAGLPNNPDSPNDNLIYLSFDEGMLPDTDQVPDVTYTKPALGGFRSMEGVELQNVITSDVIEEDKAGPVIVVAQASDNNGGVPGIQTNDFVTLTFSEGTNEPVINALNINTILSLNGGAGSWLSGSGLIVSSQWLSTTTFQVVLSTTGGVPTISVGSTISPSASIWDLSPAANPAVNPVAGPVTLGGNFASDTTPPVILEARTADLNSNGYIDALQLFFSESIDDPSVSLSLSSFTIMAGVSLNPYSIDTGDVTNDSRLSLLFSDGSLGTWETPTLSYIQGLVTDLASNPLASTSTVSLDYAPPVLTDAIAEDASGLGTGIHTGDTVKFIFSEFTDEPVINAANINSMFALSPATHTWLSGSGVIVTASSSWIEPHIFRVALSTEGGLPVLSTGATTVTPSASIRDLALVSNPSTGSVVLSGDFSTNIAPPLLLRAETVNLDADGYIDAVRFVFDKNISTGTVNYVNFTITGGVSFEPFSGSLPGNTTNDTDFYLTFTDGLLGTSQTPWVTYIQGTLVGTNGIFVESFPNQLTNDKAGPALSGVLAADGTTGVAGIQTGDIVRLTFSENTNRPTVNSSNINSVLALMPGSNTWLSGSGAIQSSSWTSQTILEIRLSTTSAAPNMSVATTTITAYNTTIITDVMANPSTGAVLLGGDFGLDITSPTITAIETADLNADGYIDAIHFVLTEPVVDSSISPSNFSITGNVSWNVFVSTTNNDTVNDNDFYFTFTDGILTTAQTPLVGYTTETLRDPMGNKLATFSPLTAQDKAPPAILLAQASDNSSQGIGIQTGDVVQLTFSENTNQPAINAANINTVLNLTPAGYTWLSGDGTLGQVQWLTGNVLKITLNVSGGSPLLAPSTSVITLNGSTSTIADIFSNASSDSIILAGDFGVDVLSPNLKSLETVDSDTDGFIDAIRLIFDESIKDSSVNANNFTVTYGTTSLMLNPFVSGYNGDTANDEKIYLAFQDGLWDSAKTPAVSYSPGTLTDLAGNFVLPFTALNSSDKAPPVLLGAIASDGSALIPDIDSDDTITFTFSEPANRPTVESANIAQLFGLIPSSHSFGNITAVWESQTQLTVRFTTSGSSSTIIPGDKIYVTGSLVLDLLVPPDANVATGTVTLSGSFKGVDVTFPALLGVSPVDGNVGISTSAAVTITFSENMDAVLVSSAVSLTAVTDNLGAAINQAVSGTKTFSSVSNVLTFVPSGSLKSNTTYELKVSTLATDTIGNPLASEWRSRFTTMMEYTQTNVVMASDSKTKLDLPPNAISGNGWVKISLDPVNAPIAVNPAAISAANAKASNQTELTGQQVLGTLREINAYKDGSLWINPLAAPATITLPYSDVNHDGFVDSTSLPVREDTLEIVYLDEKNNLWVRVPGSTVDVQNNIVTVQVSHLSVFALFGAQATDLYSAYAFPVPFVPSEGHQAITFTNLSSQTTIEIFTFGGELVRRLENISGANQILWDVTNRVGKDVASGVYLYVIKNAAAKKKGKLMIIR